MSPYIVTTTREALGEHIDSLHVERWAVATLDDARVVAFQRISDIYEGDAVMHVPGACGEALLLPESGGTVGPLPDGTVIDVAWANWDELHPTWNAANTVHDVVAVFNAAQEPPPRVLGVGE